MHSLRSLRFEPFKTPFGDDDEQIMQSSQTHPRLDTKPRSGQRDWEGRRNESDKMFSHSYDEQVNCRTEDRSLSETGEVTNTLTGSQIKSIPTVSSNTTRMPTFLNMQTAPNHILVSSNPLWLESRPRQKAKNADASIHLVTDMSKFREQPQVQQQQQQKQPPVIKFVDRTALLALEGTPSDSSIGNWNWWARRDSSTDNASDDRHVKAALSAVDTTRNLNSVQRMLSGGPLMPEIDLLERTTPVHPQPGMAFVTDSLPRHITSFPPIQTKSAWSPDTEDSTSDAGTLTSHSAFSIYPRSDPSVPSQTVPPLPCLPSAKLDPSKIQIHSVQAHKSDSVKQDSNNSRDSCRVVTDTSVTPFDDDSQPTNQSRTFRTDYSSHTRSRNTFDTAYSGWWDYVQTPFEEQLAFSFSATKNPPLTPATPQSLSSLSSRFTNRTPAVSNYSVPAPPASTQAGFWSRSPASYLLTAIPSVNTENEKERTNKIVTGKTKHLNSTQQALNPTPGVPSANVPVLSDDSLPTVTATSQSEAPARYIVPQRPSTDTIRPQEAARYLPSGHSTLTEQDECNRTKFTDAPPPYESSTRPGTNVRHLRMRSSSHPPHGSFLYSRRLVSPGLANAMSSQGLYTSEAPLTPLGVRGTAVVAGTPLPARPSGALLRGTATMTPIAAGRVRRSRHRHEKEDSAAPWAGGKKRSCKFLPTSGCFRRKSGKSHRKRRRLIYLGFSGALLMMIMLFSALGVILSKKHPSPAHATTFWLNTTTFPAIPTGVLTLLGLENVNNKPGCVSPSSLWSCSMSKEEQSVNGQYSENQLSLFVEIVYDNSTQQLWNTPDGTIPTPTPSVTLKPAAVPTARQNDAGFSPQPPPPSFREMWFLGNTTDGIVSREKAGEPTPFYITLLPSINATTAGLNTTLHHNTIPRIAADGYPEPLLNADGTGAPAIVYPLPFQQPLRLYDRGLPTEHFGFYTYFSKTIYVQSIEPGTIPLASDVNGGSLQIDANHIVTWLQTRFLVQVWTRLDNSTRLLRTQPSTFPYPITVTEDLHGGDFLGKGVFARKVSLSQQIEVTNTSPIIDNLLFGGSLINHGTNPTYGGSDGGTGGCQCTWTNFIELNGSIVA